MSLLIDGKEYKKLHFVGVFGIGMSAIAHYLSDEITITGSDRNCGSKATAEVEEKLHHLGCEIYPQDGTGVLKDTDALIISTAIEATNPDILSAQKLDIPVLHRSQILAAIVDSKKSISVTGTSGKSTVSSMIFHVLTEAGYAPSYIGGANLHSLKEQGFIGNGFKGESDLLVIEADESDGTVVRYHPYISLLLNISKDHKDEETVFTMLKQAHKQSQKNIVNGDDPRLSTLSGESFGFGEEHNIFPKAVREDKGSVLFQIESVEFTISKPGRHTIANGLATISACLELGLPLSDIANALKSYSGIERRFDIYTTKRDTKVIDDYAHNPEKVTAAIRAAQTMGEAQTVLFQPHGFGPLAFLFNEFVKTFKEEIRPQDRLILLPVYYVGGTVDQTINSNTLATALEKDINVTVKSREELLEEIELLHETRDTILLLGARDPALPQLAQDLAQKL